MFLGAKTKIQSEITTYILTKKFNQNVIFKFNYSNCWSNRLPEEDKLADFEKDFKSIINLINSLTYN